MSLRDAGLWGSHRDLRVGLVLGLGAELMYLWETDDYEGGTRVYDPEQDRESTIERTRRMLDLSGPVLAMSAACASGNHALEIGRQWLRLGLVDACVTGACDLAVTPIGLATFGNLRALSRRNSDPAAASRPFDRGRDGFVLGEGGVAFVLERAADARRRKADAYAEVAGYGATQRRPPPRDPQPRPRLCRRRDAAGPGRRPHRARTDRSHQRTCHRDARRRCRGGRGHPDRPGRRPRTESP